MITDKDFWLEAVKITHKVLLFSPAHLKEDREFAKEAIVLSGLCLSCLPKWNADRDIVWLAVNQNPYALWHADTSLREDEELAILAIRKENAAYTSVSHSLRINISRWSQCDGE